MVRVTYDNSDLNSTHLKIKFAENKDSHREVKESVELKKDQWLFWSVSFDYGQNIAIFHFSSPDFNIKKEYSLNFESFFVRQKFELDLGCFPVETIKDNEKVSIKTCIDPTIKDTFYTLEAFSEPEFLYALSHS